MLVECLQCADGALNGEDMVVDRADKNLVHILVGQQITNKSIHKILNIMINATER